jgi:hypothetical protein
MINILANNCKNVDEHEVGLMPYYEEVHLDPPLVQGHLAEWGVRLGGHFGCPARIRHPSLSLVQKKA